MISTSIQATQKICSGIIFVFLLSGCRPDVETCKKACMHFAKLHHDEKMLVELKDKSPSEELEVRERYQKTWVAIIGRDVDKGRQNCELMCRTSSRVSDVSCMVQAKDAAEARQLSGTVI